MRWGLLFAFLMIAGCASQPAETPREVVAVKPRTDADPVAASFKADARKISVGDTIQLSVVLDILAPYEIQDRHAPPPAIATTLELKLPPGFRALDDWSSPQTVRSQWPDGHAVYVGAATFTRRVVVEKGVTPGEYELSCATRYQACNDRYCLRPTQCRLAVNITVASPAGLRRRS
jgi:hypothetical protein